MRAQSPLGKLMVHYLIPGTYTLIFEEVANYKAPHPLQISIVIHQIKFRHSGFFITRFFLRLPP